MWTLSRNLSHSIYSTFLRSRVGNDAMISCRCVFASWSLAANTDRLRVSFCWPICSPLQYFFVFRFGYKRNAVSDLSNYPQSDRTSIANRVGLLALS